LIGGGKTSADQAALFNSGLVRYVDLLDSYMAPGGLCHPSDNFGTVLAAAEQAGASGEEFMLALALAYEIQCRFSAAVPVMAKGFNHATQLAISAAASAGKLLGLSTVEIANAIAIATVDNISLACVHAEPVSQWKGFSPGMTGMRAIYAASLAKRGFEGPSGLLEGPDGLERMFGQPIHVDWDDPSLEIVNQTVLKKYCSLIHGQPVLEAVLDLKRGNGLVAANIKRVHATSSRGPSISREVVAMVRRIIPRPKSKPITISNTSSQWPCSTVRSGPPSCNQHAFRRRMRRRCLREWRSVPMSVSRLAIPEN
jgi:2-methylcitrate dehydratase